MTKLELREFLPLIMRERDYIEITQEQAGIIRAIPDYQTNAILEAESGTINWKSETLPDCRPGFTRLWTRQDWEITDNVRRKSRERAAQEREASIARAEEVSRMTEAIIGHFLKMNLTRELIQYVVLGGKSPTGEKITETYNTLKAGGAKLD